MRFSHFIKYNAVPEWQNHYMDYNALKNLIYTLQTDEININGGMDDELNLDDSHSTNSNAGKLSKLKNKLFKSKKVSSNNNNTIITSSNNNHINKHDEEASIGIEKINEHVGEKTFELQDFNPHDSETNLNQNSQNNKPNKRKRNALGKVKFWDSNPFEDSNTISSNLSSSKEFDPYTVFVDELTVEKFKVDDFYKRMELKFINKFNDLVQDLERQKIIPSQSTTTTSMNGNDSYTSASIHPSTEENAQVEAAQYEDEDEDEDDDEYSEAPENTALLHYSQFNVEKQKQSILKQNIVNLYIDMSQLKAFIELNKMGFSKITKKSDKVLHLNIKAELIQTGTFYKDTYIFQKDTFTNLSSKINDLITFYAIITNQASDILEAKEELKSALHDHIVWERSNTWKDMLGLISHENVLVEDLKESDENIALMGKLQLEYYIYPLPRPINLRYTIIENVMIPKLFFTWKAFKIAFIILVTGILLGIKTFNDPVQHRCMALVECVAFLWASEALPLHITAFLVPLLVVLFRVLKDANTGEVLKATAASSKILSTMWSSTIIILLAGFTLGEVLSQYNIAKVIASWILAAAGTRPRNVLLIAMAVVFFLSMWISNVAAPVLTYSLLKPVLDTLEADQPFGKALVLGIAIAANVGGMSSPISSPQNIISMEYLKQYNIGWGQFFATALPTGIIATLICWILLFNTFKISNAKVERFVPIRTGFTLKQWFIIVVTIATILLWCVEAQIESAFGSSGIIAVLPVCIFFGSGLLSTQDFNNFPWSIVMLAMGGTALGSAVESSGLLAAIAEALQKRIKDDTPLAVLCIFGALMLVVGTFVSHTVSAIIIIPLVQEVGESLSRDKAGVLVFGCALLASAGMGLASSGFPNVTAISMLDKKGNRYLDMGTFMSRGIPCSIVVYVCVVTIGYGIGISVVNPK